MKAITYRSTVSTVKGILLLSLFAAFLLIMIAETMTQASPAQPLTVITVNSGTDPDNSKSRTCVSHTPCTLRRAIVQARALSAAERPVVIAFDIPAQPAEGYVSALHVWELNVLTTSDPSVFRTLEGGQITIDGETQPGGRRGGPAIILIGPGTGGKDGLIVGVNSAGAHDGNVVRGLGFQNFKTHLIVSSNDNTIEDNWFGLNSEGDAPYLRRNDPKDGSGNTGVALSAGVAGNLINDNVFLGFDGVAAAVRGQGNTFSNNLVGTTPEGSAPGKQTDPDLLCTPDDWLGGGGITVEGTDARVEDNLFVGLRQEIFVASTQPAAIQASGAGHTLLNNRIGITGEGLGLGVCGRGIYLIGGPQDLDVRDNKIVNSGLSAISLNGALYDANTLRSNLIRSRSVWPQVEGNPAAEDAIQVGPSLPAAFADFQPAGITAIQGVNVSGTNGIGSPCPRCVIELFLDDIDGVKEALATLAVVNADANGDWTATLPAPLSSDEGLRTTSTTTRFNTIANMKAGTTTGLSRLYRPPSTLFLPSIKH